MNSLQTSLVCFLAVLGQLCLNGEVEFNLSVDFSASFGIVLTLAGAVFLTLRK